MQIRQGEIENNLRKESKTCKKTAGEDAAETLVNAKIRELEELIENAANLDEV